jgi:7-cyano-7-deazaguanine synthase in queuosine biosynthesis
MKKNILQSISGGFDSTYLLLKNLKNDDVVYPVYISAKNINPIKQHIELHVVIDLITNLQKQFSNLKDLKLVPVSMKTISGLYSDQPILWLLGLFYEAKKRDIYDEVHIGYIMGDIAVSLLAEMHRFWKSLFSFSLAFEPYTVPELCFPLVKYPKEYIIDSLEYTHRDIALGCWTCERPQIIKQKQRRNDGGEIEAFIEPCGECTPCKKLKSVSESLFNSMKRYGAVFHKNHFTDEVNVEMNKIIKNIYIDRIPAKFIDLKAVDNETMEKIHKSLERKETIGGGGRK